MLAENREIQFLKQLPAMVQNVDFSKCFFHFQPIYNLKTMKVATYEALLRTRDTSVDSIESFVVSAISQGKADELTQFTFDSMKPYLQCCKYEDVVFSINLEPLQLASRNFPRIATDFIKSNGIGVERLLLEITERPCSHKCFARLVKNVNYLSDHGFNFAIDDFGTGVSNFEMLTALNVGIVKLDGIFSRRAFSAPKNQQALNVAASLQEVFGCKVCVEGLETGDHIEMAKKLGFVFGQGFGLARPKLLDLD